MLKFSNFYNPANQEPLNMSYTVEEYGWGHIKLQQGDQEWESDTSSVMQDVLGNLVRGALFLVDGGRSITLHIDPEGATFEMIATYDSIKVIEVQSKDILFTATTPWHDFAGEVVQVAGEIAEEIGLEEYKKKWGVRFPEQELRILESHYKLLTKNEHKVE